MATLAGPEVVTAAAGGRLIDRFMPQADATERHETLVRAPADVVFDVAQTFDLQSIPLVRAIFWLRARILGGAEMPAHLFEKGLVAETQALGWRILAERPGRELVAGSVTQPWKGDVIFTPVEPDRFATYSEPDMVKIVWTLEADPLGPALSRFRTETRVLATDEAARTKFGRYWRWAGLGIVGIRWLLLPALRREAERRVGGGGLGNRLRARSVRADPSERTRTLPGDELIEAPLGVVTHAITIRRSPHDVWPWLLQMGAGRAGWYSYDFIDNGRRPSAERILPEFQSIGIGTVFPALPGVTDAFKVLQCEPEHSLVLGWVPEPNGAPVTTWALKLEKGEPGCTRLIERGRVGSPYRPYGLPQWLAKRLAPLAHAVMVRKHLLGIATRAESVGG
jgi:hypothetical protein